MKELLIKHEYTIRISSGFFSFIMIWVMFYTLFNIGFYWYSVPTIISEIFIFMVSTMVSANFFKE